MIRVLLLFLFMPLVVEANDDCNNPVQSAKYFFEKHQNFYFQKPPEALLTPKFFKAVSNEIKCLEEKGMCALDYAPWIGANDGKIGNPITFKLSGDLSLSGQAIVKMEYPFELYPNTTLKIQTVQIVLTKNVEGCWKVDDLITPLGDSLAKLFSDE